MFVQRTKDCCFLFVFIRQGRAPTGSQSGAADASERPKDDETIVKNLLRTLVGKVARRLLLKDRRRNRPPPSENGNPVGSRSVRGRGQLVNGSTRTQGKQTVEYRALSNDRS